MLKDLHQFSRLRDLSTRFCPDLRLHLCKRLESLVLRSTPEELEQINLPPMDSLLSLNLNILNGREHRQAKLNAAFALPNLTTLHLISHTANSITVEDIFQEGAPTKLQCVFLENLFLTTQFLKRLLSFSLPLDCQSNTIHNCDVVTGEGPRSITYRLSNISCALT